MKPASSRPDRRMHFVRARSSRPEARTLLIEETLESIRSQAVSATLTLREYQSNGWEPIPTKAREALARLRPAKAQETDQGLRWTVPLSGHPDLWDVLKAYLPHDDSATLQSLERVVWRSHGSSGPISVWLSDDEANALSGRCRDSLEVVPASEVTRDDEIGRYIIRQRGGSTRRSGRWLREYMASANGAAPWGAIAATAAAAVVGALLATAVDEVVNFSEEPSVPGAGIGMAVTFGYSLLAMFVDWFHSWREKRP